MPFLRPLVAGAVALAWATSAHAQDPDFDRAIMGGPLIGTYYQIAQEIGELAGSRGLDLEVMESEGGLDNFLAVRKRPNTQLGFSRSDILEYMRTYELDDPAVRQIAFGMRIALPLYDEEVHVVARRDVEAFEDLEGLRVGVGPDGSGTFLTSQLVLDLAGVEPAEKVSMPFQDMPPALFDGDLDAFFHVGGAPVNFLLQPGINAEEYHLLEITNETLRTVYAPATIPAGTYDYQDGPVETVAAKAVLMTFEFDPDRDAYHAQACDTVSDVSNLIVTRIDQLREEGHPKWSQIDLTDIPPGWEVASCVSLGLEPSYTVQCTPPGDAEGGAVQESDVNRVYRDQICSLVDC